MAHHCLILVDHCLVQGLDHENRREEMAGHSSRAHEPGTELRHGQRFLVPQVPHAWHHAQIKSHLRRRHGNHHVTGYSFRVVHRQLECRNGSHVLAHHANLAQIQNVEQFQDVSSSAGPIDVPVRQASPSLTAKVGRDGPIPLSRKCRHDFSPLPPRLTESVQQEHRVAGPHSRHVHLPTGDFQEFVVDPSHHRHGRPCLAFRSHFVSHHSEILGILLTAVLPRAKQSRIGDRGKGPRLID